MERERERYQNITKKVKKKKRENWCHCLFKGSVPGANR